MNEKASSQATNTGHRSSKGDGLSSRQVLDVLSQRVPHTVGFVLSLMPRATLNIVQPARSPENMVRAYASDFHRQDRLAWQAIIRHRALRATEVWGRDFDSSNYYQAFLKPLGIRYAVAAPLAGPIFAGYPGVVLLGRGPEESDFTDSELAELDRVAKTVTVGDRAAAREHASSNGDTWSHNAPVRFMIFDREAKQLFPTRDIELDDRLKQQLQQRTRQSMEQLKRGYVIADRMLLPDTWGDLWVFRGAVFTEYLAMSDGPVMVFCLQPEAAEWTAVKPADVQADQEIVRLLPSLRFMQQEFSNNPTLDDIAKKAHLSPFHFHRRFTDLIGQTPKHFLLSCQIHQAKRMLISRKRELSQIATECGFAHQSHFTSRFKQATGLTPTRWRRLAAQISEGATSN